MKISGRSGARPPKGFWVKYFLVIGVALLAVGVSILVQHNFKSDISMPIIVAGIIVLIFSVLLKKRN